MIFNTKGGAGYTINEIAKGAECISGNINVNANYIGSGAFMGTDITSINAPNTTTIQSMAFYLCYSLVSATFPKTTVIDNSYAFANCSKLKTISFPLVQNIGAYTFRSCWSLTTASFPVCSRVYSNAFLNCSSLTTIRLGGAMSLIGSYAFSSCRRLVSLYLTGCTSVPTLSNSAFLSTPIGGYSTDAGAYGKVYVPSSLLTSFKTATNWSSISARIVAG